MARSYPIRVHSQFKVEEVLGADFKLGAHVSGNRYHLLANDDSLDFVGNNDLVIEFDPSLCPEDCEQLEFFGEEWAEELRKAKEWFSDNE